jgi:ferredoxin-NADP reductase
MNERNICIGDIISIGPEVKLQVSLPRQPCFKLNHRFNLKGFAPQTWKKSRTGWYYRVLKEGWIGVGDEIVLLERRHPEWTIERIQEYLHRDTKNLAMLEELAGIQEFGAECKRGFKRLLDAIHEEEKRKIPEVWRSFKLVEKKRQTPRISSFVFQAVDGEGEGEELDLGVFIRLRLPNDLIRPYSVVSGTTNKFELGIQREDPSRGGSIYLHDKLEVGDRLEVGKITEGVPIPSQASNHIFIAAGVGITAFLMHMDVYSQINFNYTLHYAVRSSDEIAFSEKLGEMGEKVVVYDKQKGERMDVRSILENRTWNSYIYVCGPDRLIDDVVKSSTVLGISQDEIHYEAFQSQTGGDPFTVEVNDPQGPGKKGKLDVGEGETLLQVLRKEGWDVDSSCETGNCGTCRVKVCEGTVVHRGSALSEGDKGEGGMLSCVSRGVGHLVIEF